MNECVDLAAVKFDHKTAIAGPTSCPATTHSACGGFPSGFGFDGHTVGRLPNHANVLSDDYCSVIVPDGIGCRTLSRQCRPAFRARSEYVNNSAGRPAAAAEPARESPTGAPQEGVGSLSARAPTELIPTASLKKLGDRTARSPPCRRVRSRLRPYRRPRSYTAQLLAKILLPIRRDIRVPSRAAAT